MRCSASVTTGSGSPPQSQSSRAFSSAKFNVELRVHGGLGNPLPSEMRKAFPDDNYAAIKE
jgi:hypothetical protein